MNAEILSAVPTSGRYPEHTFGSAVGYLWVKFEDEGLESWVGSFGTGEQRGSYAAVSVSGAWAFVLARGPGYFVDLDSRSLLIETDRDWLVQALYVPDADIVVACDFTDIYLYSPSGLVWSSGRVTLDGIELSESRGTIVVGTVYSHEASAMIPFELDVSAKVYRSEYRF